MRYKTRKYLFLGFTLLFFISIAPIVLYTQGYRLDTNTLSLKKTGGLDLDVNITEARVFLNDELERETNFIFRSAIFRNIIPGTYSIRLEKEGYFSWQKTTTVEEGQVTKFPGIRLFPRELSLGTIIKETENVFISDNGAYAIIEAPLQENDSNTAEGSQLIFYDINARHQSPFLELEEGEALQRVNWSPNSGAFSLIIERRALGPVFYTGISAQNPQPTNQNSFLAGSYPAVFNEDNIVIPSDSANSLYVFLKNTDNSFSMNHIDLEQRLIRPNIIADILGFEIMEGDIFFLDELGSIQRAPLSGGEATELTPTAISQPTTDGTEVIVRRDRSALIVINNGSIFLWQENKPLEKIGHSVISASFSPDNQKLLFWNENDEAVVYWLKEVFGPPQRAIGSTEAIKQNGIISAHWISGASDHILLRTAGKLTFAELDSRDRRNTASYDIETSPAMLNVDISSEQIYTLSNTNDLIFLRYNN